MMRGKWKHKELSVYWFCRNCWQKGIAGITLHPAMGTYDPPSKDDILRIIQTTCHTDCTKPEITFSNKKEKQKEKEPEPIKQTDREVNALADAILRGIASRQAMMQAKQDAKIKRMIKRQHLEDKQQKSSVQ